MGLIKNWLRGTMSQERLNHYMLTSNLLLSIQKGKTDEINLKYGANGFCEASEMRKRTFGIFCDTERLFIVEHLKCAYFLFFNLIHVLNKAQNLFLLPRNFRNQKNRIAQSHAQTVPFLSTKSPHQEIRLNYSILRSESFFSP